MYVQEGEKFHYATTNLDSTGGFGFVVTNCKEGFYYLGDTLKRNYTRLYLKANDQLSVILEEDGSYKVVNGSAENKLIQQWAAMSNTVERAARLGDSTTYYSFFPALTTLAGQSDAFAKKLITPNSKFNQLMKQTIAMDMQRWAAIFVSLPHSVHPTRAQWPSFYNTIAAPNKFNSSSILQIGEAADWLSLYCSFYFIHVLPRDTAAKRMTPAQIVTRNLREIDNDTLKGVYLANTLKMFKSYEELTETIHPYQQYLLTPLANQRYFTAMKSLNTMRKGAEGFNFTYPDITGKQVSFKDLKGKVVVVDVWATWCGPCKKELPHLQKLEEEYAGNANVVFLGVSVDEEKDFGKWQQFVKEHALGGVQLFAKGWSDISKFYSINTIPRFMVFDQQGKIVTIDGPRPSEPELKKLIEQTLQGS